MSTIPNTFTKCVQLFDMISEAMLTDENQGAIVITFTNKDVSKFHLILDDLKEDLAQWHHSSS